MVLAMPALPTWALVAMWAATITGAYFLSVELTQRLRIK